MFGGADRGKVPPISSDAVRLVANAALPLSQLVSSGFQAVRDAIGDARVVMIGEGTHGTQEFYKLRADLTKQLIEHHGFSFVAVEGDWPDAYRLNRWVKGREGDSSLESAMDSFERWPRWMWRNTVVKEFIAWLRAYNDRTFTDTSNKVGFYGLDLYSFFASAEKVVEYLRTVDPGLAQSVQQRYSTLGEFAHEAQQYPLALRLGLVESQQAAVAAVVKKVVQAGWQHVINDGGFLDKYDEYFFAEQNAKVVKDCEHYYRSMFAGSVVTWNIRDTHMVNTLCDLITYHEYRQQVTARAAERGGASSPPVSPPAAPPELKDLGGKAEARGAGASSQSFLDRMRAAERAAGQPPVRCVIWAHNSHLGDAAATTYVLRGEYNVGQLVREKFGLTATYSVGFTTNRGTVSAGAEWGERRETMSLTSPLSGSVEDFMKQVYNLRVPKPMREPGHAKFEAGHALFLRSNPRASSAAAGAAGAAGPAQQQQQQSDTKQQASTCTPDPAVVDALTTPRLERAIGVCYVRATERWSHYIECSLARQFDCAIHLDYSNALTPLDPD